MNALLGFVCAIAGFALGVLAGVEIAIREGRRVWREMGKRPYWE